MKDWFASDHHFFHRNIIDFCKRPFSCLEQMHEEFIRQHNSVVSQEDRVWFVGDFSFGEPDDTSNVLRRMHGQKFLIKGNHDHQRRLNGTIGFAGVFQYKELKIGEDHIILCHFPLLMWNRAHHGSYHLHGHSHGTLRYPPSHQTACIFDVGVDHIHALNGNYSPVDWDWLRHRMSRCRHVQIDHHHGKET